MAASRAFSSGTMRREIFLPRASMAMGRAPRTPRTPPSSDNSPTNRQSGTSFLLRPPYAPRIPSAIGKSKPEPSLRMSAGAKLMVMWVKGDVIPTIFQSGSHTVAAFPNRRVWQTYGVEMIFIGLDGTGKMAPSEEQLDQLSQVIARSQRSFKELIDSFDDIAFAFSLDGTLRTVNRSVTQLLGVPYSAIVGCKLDEFIEEPSRTDLEQGLPRFIERRRWSGIVQVRLKKRSRSLFFDCVLNAIVKGDEVVGVSTLARDVTEEREKERRFTELFETLQEGVYFSRPEGKLLDVNPALVSMLGYSSKEELLAVEPSGLNLNPDEDPVLGRGVDDRGGTRTREITLRRKDATPVIFQDASRAVWDGSGNIIRYQGTLVDVTEK